MRINKIIINNFKIYKGKNHINFKHSKGKRNIYIIAGQNGYGKTTFLTALLWGFYGKFIANVDEKFKKEIYERGGYNKYATSLLNNDVLNNPNANKIFSVEIELSGVNIPSVPCNKLVIKREFNLETKKEKIKIFIDEYENELTKAVGTDIFINDFILPRDIAKFFLFDAEKIVTLAEIKTIHEKRQLSKAYSDILGITKYENLRDKLESLRLKLRKKSANFKDKQKFEKLQREVHKIEETIKDYKQQVTHYIEEIEKLKVLSEQYQEKLIREGNSLTADDLIQLKKLRDALKIQHIEAKAKLRELIELAPFAIAGGKTKKLYKQVKKELLQKQNYIDSQFIENKIKKIKDTIINQIISRDIPLTIKNEIIDVITKSINKNIKEQRKIVDKVLLDLSREQSNEFIALYENIKNSYSVLFKQVVKEEKNIRMFLSKTKRKISNAEIKGKDPLINKYKKHKIELDTRIEELTKKQNNMHEKIGSLQQELITKQKIISELSNKIELDEINEKKDKLIKRLIYELNEFLIKYKSEKKKSLKKRIKHELSKLMHKKDFISEVEIDINADIIDINLIDKQRNKINKESLSKGEQQLYASALLKSLIDESGIKFPVFIDSPLQKFDKKHAYNIITEFYPSISDQVIIFPLLEKELSKEEYKTLFPYVAQTFIIENKNGGSKIREFATYKLFNIFENKSNVYTR